MDNATATAYEVWTKKLLDLCLKSGEDIGYLTSLYSFQTAFEEGMTPEAALKDCMEWLEA